MYVTAQSVASREPQCAHVPHVRQHVRVVALEHPDLEVGIHTERPAMRSQEAIDRVDGPPEAGAMGAGWFSDHRASGSPACAGTGLSTARAAARAARPGGSRTA